MKIKVDLFKDWTDGLRAELQSMGYQPRPTLTTEEIATIYFNALHRRIPKEPRAVEYSRQFVCPQQLNAGMQEIERKIKIGDDLTPHLSRTLKREDFDDDALNDFGIHHLHLGTVIESDGFSKRSGPLLFVLFRNTVAYLIQVFTHGDFSNREVVEIVHENWPETISSRRVPALDLSVRSSSEDIAYLRKGHVNTSLKMRDGAIYMPIGGGLMSNGTALQVVLQRDRAIDVMTAAVEQFQTKEAEIATLLEKQGCSENEEPEFKLDPEKGGLGAVCEKYDLRIKLVTWPVVQ